MAKEQSYSGVPLVDDLLIRVAKVEKDNEDLKRQVQELSLVVHKLHLYVPTYK